MRSTFLAVGTAFALAATAASAATYTVINTADTGAGSLRQAILDANATPGVADTIVFNIPGSGVHTITPASPLPTVTDAVTIDGYTQPGSSPNTNGPGLPDSSIHTIELDGANTGGGNGQGALVLQGSFAFVLRGLTINRAPSDGVLVFTATGAIEGCFLGVDPTGSTALPSGVGVEIEGSAGVRVGGLLPAQRNVVSGNSSVQIALGCLFGSGSGHLIEGNFIGTDATGAAVPAGDPHSAVGVDLCFSATNVTIGGATPEARNVISGNGSFGINIANSFSNDVENNVVQGNYIGTDLTGTAPMGNGNSGIRVNQPSNSVLDNVISANGSLGIELSGSACPVKGNRIGTDATGTQPMGNASWGILVFSSNSLIGGTAVGEGNVIAYNGAGSPIAGGVGVEVGTGNVIRRNSIHDNRGLGIDLGIDGATPNDELDGDAGANNLQNFPVFKSVTPGTPTAEAPESGTRIQGVLHSTPSTTYDLDFYSNPACVNFPKDFLEGQTYLGSGVVSTDGAGEGIFDVTVPMSIQPGERVSATATDPAGNTSEFSQRLPFSILPASGPSTGGTNVTIAGTDFENLATVTIGGVAATSVVVTSFNQITATTPALAAGTVNDVTVMNTEGTTGTLEKGWVADFLDVPNSQQFYSFVTKLVSNALTAGVGGGNYGVDQSTLRQQMAVFLLKGKHGLCYVPPPCTGVFPDVPCPSIFADWIEALFSEGITGGCGGGHYCPTNPVRRDQMAVFLLKAEHGSSYVPPSCTGVFPDVPCPSQFADWIERLAAENITGGCGGGNYCPQNPNTRGQMAVFIVKTFNLQ